MQVHVSVWCTCTVYMYRLHMNLFFLPSTQMCGLMAYTTITIVSISFFFQLFPGKHLYIVHVIVYTSKCIIELFFQCLVLIGRTVMSAIGISSPPDIYTVAVGLYFLWLSVRAISSIVIQFSKGFQQFVKQFYVWIIQVHVKFAWRVYAQSTCTCMYYLRANIISQKLPTTNFRIKSHNLKLGRISNLFLKHHDEIHY